MNDQILGYGRIITKSYFYEGQVLNSKAEGFGKYEDEFISYEGEWK